MQTICTSLLTDNHTNIPSLNTYCTIDVCIVRQKSRHHHTSEDRFALIGPSEREHLSWRQPVTNHNVQTRLIERVHSDGGDCTIVSVQVDASETHVQQPHRTTHRQTHADMQHTLSQQTETHALTCVVPRTLGSYGDRTFAAAGPRLWNSLPAQLRNPDITRYRLFRRQLKGHLFREAWTQRSVISDMRRHRKTLTYLLTQTSNNNKSVFGYYVCWQCVTARIHLPLLCAVQQSIDICCRPGHSSKLQANQVPCWVRQTDGWQCLWS